MHPQIPCRITPAQHFPSPLRFYCSSFFPGVSSFIICSLFKIIKERNIWFMAIILHIRGGKYTVCLLALVVQFAGLISSPNFLTHSFFKLFPEDLIWHSEQKTNLIYLFFSSSLSHPCNISAWLAACVNGFCGGISGLGIEAGNNVPSLSWEDRFQNNTKAVSKPLFSSREKKSYFLNKWSFSLNSLWTCYLFLYFY